VAGCCEYGDGPLGSGATELVSSAMLRVLVSKVYTLKKTPQSRIIAENLIVDQLSKNYSVF
jgi:hypothetical protein